MRQLKIWKVLLILTCSTLPFAAYANAGTPMIWFSIFHLIFINAIIGFIESRILIKRGFPNKTWLIVVANYISMIVGLFFIAPYFTNNLYHINFWSGETFQYHASYKYDWTMTFLAGIVLSFAATLVIELPFYYYALKDKTQRELIALPFVIANLTTYIVMTTTYYLFILSA